MAKWFFIGFFFFLCLPFAGEGERRYFLAKEPRFASPVFVPSGSLRIRNDGYGKGHFGASRNKGRTHEGVDLLVPVGNPVFASKSGRVLRAEEGRGYGFYVEILHPDGLLTRYAHLSSLRVKEGQWVRRGEEIAKSGKTGNAANPHIVPHLHFEIRNAKGALDPLRGLLDPTLLSQ